MRIAIFTLTRDRLGYTQRMFEQLKKCGVEYDHFVLDNGSTDGTPAWLTTVGLKGFSLMPNNMGLWKGIEHILIQNDYFQDYDLVLKLDNDLEFTEDGWLAKLIKTYEENNFDVLSPFVEGICSGQGGLPRISTDNNISTVKFVGGACLLTDSYFYHDLIMPNSGKAYGWDRWFCKDKKCGIVEDIHVKHDTLKQEKDMPDYYARKLKEVNEVYDKNG